MKAAQKPLTAHLTPRGFLDMLRDRRPLSEAERVEARRAAVQQMETWAADLELAKAMPTSPMRTALVAKYEHLISGLNEFVDRT